VTRPGIPATNVRHPRIHRKLIGLTLHYARSTAPEYALRWDHLVVNFGRGFAGEGCLRVCTTSQQQTGGNMYRIRNRAVVVASVIACVTAVVAGVGPIGALAAVGPAQARQTNHYPYRLIMLATLGGPEAGVGNGPFLGNSAVVAGTADTATLDPYGATDNSSFNGDKYVQHTYLWSHGALTDLGALGPDPAKNSSYANWLSPRGAVAGLSDNGTIDPLTHSEEVDAVVWQDGKITNLGTFGGNEGQAFGMNSQGEVTGGADNATPDKYSILGDGQQTRAFLWANGHLRDLGTLGGPDSLGWFLNDHGQVLGVSDTSATPDPVTGQPPASVFLWQNGTMRDLGNLGGSVPTFGGLAAFNDAGEVTGQSNLAGNKIFHAFLWNGHKMIDLGTFGGALSSPTWMNDRGEVIGWADLPKYLGPNLGEPGDQMYQAFVWDNGAATDLGTLPGDKCSTAWGINDEGVIVGAAGVCHGAVDAFIEQNGKMVNLNTLVAPSPLHLTNALSINDAGEIIGEGMLNGNMRTFMLIPNSN